MKIFKTGLFVCVCLILMFAGCKGKKKQQAAVLPVNAVKVIKTDLPFEMQYPAQIDGSVNVQVRAQVSGILKAELYTEGAYVKEGTQLFQIDDSAYKAALKKAEGTLAQAAADNNRTEKDYKRMAALRKSGSVSKKDYDDALAAYESAKANVTVAQSEVDTAKINLGYTKVYAPVSGITGVGVQSLGALIDPEGDTGLLTVMVQIDPLFINFSMPSGDFTRLAQDFVKGEVKTDDKNSKPILVQVILPDGSVYPDTAKIIFLDNTENPNTSSIFLRASMPNPGNQRLLMPGQFVRVNLIGVHYKDQLVIPDSAVLAVPAGDTVYVIKEDNTLEQRMVTGELKNSIYMISSGLLEGETVVFDGLIKVRAGEKVVPQMHDFKINADSSTASQETVPVNIAGVPGVQKTGGSKAASSETALNEESASAIPFMPVSGEEKTTDIQQQGSVAVSSPAAKAAAK